MEEASKLELTAANTRCFGFHNFGWEIDQNFDVHELCLVIHLYTFVYNLTRLIIKSNQNSIGFLEDVVKGPP